MDLKTILVAFALGGAVGLLQTLVGLGGGVLIVPLLQYFALTSHRVAIATSLISLAPIALANVIRLSGRGEIVWLRSILIGGSAAGAAWWAAGATARVEPRLLTLGFAVVVGTLAFQCLMKAPTKRYDLPAWIDVPMGFFAGVISGFTGLSGGVVNTPYLSRVRSIPPTKVIPTSLGAFLFICLAGALSFIAESLRTGKYDLMRWDLIGPIVLGAIITSTAGIRLQPLIPARLKLAVLGIILLALCVQSVLKLL